MNKLLAGFLLCLTLAACVPGDAGDDDDAPATDDGARLSAPLDV